MPVPQLQQMHGGSIGATLAIRGQGDAPGFFRKEQHHRTSVETRVPAHFVYEMREPCRFAQHNQAVHIASTKGREHDRCRVCIGLRGKDEQAILFAVEYPGHPAQDGGIEIHFEIVRRVEQADHLAQRLLPESLHHHAPCRLVVSRIIPQLFGCAGNALHCGRADASLPTQRQRDRRAAPPRNVRRYPARSPEPVFVLPSYYS